MKARMFFLVLVTLCLAGAARSQQPEQDPIGQSFFAPELVIQNQEAIGLSAAQKDALKTEIRQAQLKFTELQWKLQDEMEKLANLQLLPPVGFLVSCFPYKIKGASAGFTRAVALFEDHECHLDGQT